MHSDIALIELSAIQCVWQIKVTGPFQGVHPYMTLDAFALTALVSGMPGSEAFTGALREGPLGHGP